MHITTPIRFQDRYLGVTLVLLATVGFGLNPLFARWAYSGGLGPEAALMYRFLFPALCMAPFLGGVRRAPAAAWKALGLGIFVAVGSITYFQALSQVPVATAALVYFTHPLFTVVLGRLIFATPVSRESLGTVGLVLIACALILSPEGLTAAQLQALTLSFVMPISFALLMLGFEHWLPPLPLWTRISVTLWGQILLLGPMLIFIPLGPVFPNNQVGWWGVLGLAALSSLLPQILLASGIPLTGAARASVIGTAELITALLSGWLILREPVLGREVLGAILILAAILLSRPRKPVEL